MFHLSRWKRFTPHCGLFFLGLAVGVLGHFAFSLHHHRRYAHSDPPDMTQMRELGQYHFVNPLLECDAAQGLIDSYNENFRAALSEKVNGEIAAQDADNIAVYFRDLNNGPTFGINEDEKFIPASLLKVPVLMTYYREAEADPSLLKKTFELDERYEPPETGVQHIAPKEEIQVGKEYTVEELLRRIVIYSDNQAVTLLINHISAPSLHKLYRMLGVNEGVLNGPDGRLSVREYATFFRILFNASYISPEYSEKALSLLSQTKFTNGLVQGIPDGITVAHKFGEGGDEETHQIHDCGIVYFPNHPYLLCVMSKGKDIDHLERAIGEISHFVYLQVLSEYMTGLIGRKNAATSSVN